MYLPRVLEKRFSDTFASLREREFVWFLSGNSAFFTGMQMQFILRYFIAWELTESALATTLLTLPIALPFLTITPFGGVIADRFNKRTLLIVTQSASAVVSVVTTVMVFCGWMTYEYLFFLSFASGAIFSLNGPARQALVPLLVPQHLLMNAVSLQMGSQNLTRIIAPAIGGLLIAPIGVGWVFMITTFCFVFAIISEFRLPSHGLIGSTKSESTLESMRGGFNFIRSTPTIALLLVAGMVMPFFAFPLQTLLQVHSSEVLGMSDGRAYGFLMAAGGIGGVIGAILSATLDKFPSKGRLMFVSGLIMASFIFAFARTDMFLFSFLFFAGSNIGQMMFMASNNTVIQALSPGEMRGRVNSFTMMSFGVMPLGVIPLGLAADEFGTPATFTVASLILVSVIVLTFLLVPRLRNLRLEFKGEAALSHVQAEELIAQGKLSRAEADVLIHAEVDFDDVTSTTRKDLEQ